MRRVLCKNCGSRYTTEGKQILYAATDESPAEYGRITKGKAKTPTAEQRVVYVNDVPHPLDNMFYNCDMCNDAIKPGDEAVCLTVWTSYQKEPADWENEFIQKGV